MYVQTLLSLHLLAKHIFLRFADIQRDQITVTKEGLGELYESKIKSFFDESVLSFSRHGRIADID